MLHICGWICWDKVEGVYTSDITSLLVVTGLSKTIVKVDCLSKRGEVKGVHSTLFRCAVIKSYIVLLTVVSASIVCTNNILKRNYAIVSVYSIYVQKFADKCLILTTRAW